MTLTVDVTQGDIANGTRGACARCPVALAINRAAVRAGLRIHGNLEARVADIVTVGGLIAKTPFRARNFIEVFDSGGETKPFSFTLELDAA